MAVQAEQLHDVVVVDCEGKEVGAVIEVHRDAFSGRPAWVAVRGGLAGLLHGKSLVPIGEAEPVDGRLQVPYDAATIRKAPYVDLSAEEALNEEADRQGEDESIRDDRQARRPREDHWALYEYYGLPFGRPDTTGAASPAVDYGFGNADLPPEETPDSSRTGTQTTGMQTTGMQTTGTEPTSTRTTATTLPAAVPTDGTGHGDPATAFTAEPAEAYPAEEPARAPEHH